VPLHDFKRHLIESTPQFIERNSLLLLNVGLKYFVEWYFCLVSMRTYMYLPFVCNLTLKYFCSSGIIDCMLFTFENRDRPWARERQSCGKFITTKEQLQ